MSCQGWKFLGEFRETRGLFCQKHLAELLIPLYIPGAATIGLESVDIPVWHIEQDGILDNFLEVPPEQHGIKEDACDALPDLLLQKLMIAVVIDKHFIS